MDTLINTVVQHQTTVDFVVCSINTSTHLSNSTLDKLQLHLEHQSWSDPREKAC